jgi:hypothetical protein
MNRKFLAELIANLKSLLAPQNKKLVPVKVYAITKDRRNLAS